MIQFVVPVASVALEADILFSKTNLMPLSNAHIMNPIMATVSAPVAYISNIIDSVPILGINKNLRLYNSVGNNRMYKDIINAEYEFCDDVIIVDRNFSKKNTIDELIAAYISEEPKLHIYKSHDKDYNIHNTIAVDSEKEAK